MNSARNTKCLMICQRCSGLPSSSSSVALILNTTLYYMNYHEEANKFKTAHLHILNKNRNICFCCSILAYMLFTTQPCIQTVPIHLWMFQETKADCVSSRIISIGIDLVMCLVLPLFLWYTKFTYRFCFAFCFFFPFLQTENPNQRKADTHVSAKTI